MEALQTYDAASREMLMTLLPMAARVGDGGIEHYHAARNGRLA